MAKKCRDLGDYHDTAADLYYGWDRVFEPEGYGGRTRAELSEKEDLESYEKIRDLDSLRAFLAE